jgi:hypothetical protein
MFKDGGTMTIPITLDIKKQPLEEEPTQILDIKLEPMRRNIEPGEILEFQVILNNFRPEIKLNVSTFFELIDPKTNTVILRQEEVLTLQNILNIMRSIPIPSELKGGDYIIKVTTHYQSRNQQTTTFAIAHIKVSKPFMEIKILGIYLWQILSIIIISVLLVIGGSIYRKRAKERRRYKALVDFKYLPKKTSRSIDLGKVAETRKEAYLDMEQLKTHTLIAGATGGGKTISAQIIVEEALKKNAAAVVFDPTGQWSGFLRKCIDEDMLNKYSKFGMKKSDAKAFKGNIYTITNPREIINIKELMNPGQITIFSMHKLHASSIDIVVASTIQQIFDANLEESKELKLVLVYDEIHRLLSRFGGTGHGILQVERACREFRKWGVGLVLISQMLGDFIENIHANIATEIQMKTKHLGDLERIKSKGGKKILKILSEAATGVGMLINSQYNKGLPYFIAFRPITHNTTKLSDKELGLYHKYNEKIFDIKFEIEQLKELDQDVFDIELELKLALDKLQQGKFKITEIYIESLIPKLGVYWKKLDKKPKKRIRKVIKETQIHKGIITAKKQREDHLNKERKLQSTIDEHIKQGYTKEQIRASLLQANYPIAEISNILSTKTDSITRYIKVSLKKKRSLDNIKKELLNAGFNEKVINDKIKSIIK